jgi:hypothetical protein
MSKIWGFSGNCGTKDKAFAVDALSPGASREISQWSSEKIFIAFSLLGAGLSISLVSHTYLR